MLFLFNYNMPLKSNIKFVCKWMEFTLNFSCMITDDKKEEKYETKNTNMEKK